MVRWFRTELWHSKSVCSYGTFLFVNHFLVSFRLAITTVNEASFNYSPTDALFAMFDGGLNNEVPSILKNKLPDILKSEYEQCDQANVYLKHTFLTLQKFVLLFVICSL